MRLLNAVVERMEISSITRSYSRIGRIEYPPSSPLKILLYAYMRHIYSSREIERACRENMADDAGTDSYICAAGKLLTFDYDFRI